MFLPAAALIGGLGYLSTGYANKQIDAFEKAFNLIPKDLQESISWNALKKLKESHRDNADRYNHLATLEGGATKGEEERFKQELATTRTSWEYALKAKIDHHAYQGKALLAGAGIAGTAALAMSKALPFLPGPLKLAAMPIIALGSVGGMVGTNVVLRQDKDFFLFVMKWRQGILDGSFGNNNTLRTVFSALNANQDASYLRTTSPEEILKTLKGQGDQKQLKLLAMAIGTYLQTEIKRTKISKGNRDGWDIVNPLSAVAGIGTSDSQYYDNINYEVYSSLYSTLKRYVAASGINLDYELANLAKYKAQNKPSLDLMLGGTKKISAHA